MFLLNMAQHLVLPSIYHIKEKIVTYEVPIVYHIYLCIVVQRDCSDTM